MAKNKIKIPTAFDQRPDATGAPERRFGKENLVKVGRTWRSQRVVKCEDCSIEFLSVWPRQLVCEACGIVRRLVQSGRSVSARAKSRSAALDEIAATDGRQETRILEILDDMPRFAWSVIYSVPFAADASKNRRWSNNGKGGVFLTQSVRNYQDAVIAETRQALRPVKVRQNKLWISFLVEKPNNRFDAVNVIDTLCDAIKVAAGLDDRWFCLGRLDWCIKKTDPSIVIKISQESNEDVICCSHCGEIKATDNYQNRVRNPLGKARVCRSCASKLGAATTAARRAAAARGTGA